MMKFLCIWFLIVGFSFTCALSADPSYKIIILAPEGKELVTQAGSQIQMTRSGYVYGTITTPESKEQSFVYNIDSGQFEFMGIVGEKKTISLVSEFGLIAGHKPSSNRYFPVGYLLDSKTGYEFTLPSLPWPWEDSTPVILGMTKKNKIYLKSEVLEHFYVYDHANQNIEGINDKAILQINSKGQYVFKPRKDWCLFYDEIWFFDPQTGSVPMGIISLLF